MSAKILELQKKPDRRRVPNQITAPEALRIAIAHLTELATAVRSAKFGVPPAEAQAQMIAAACLVA